MNASCPSVRKNETAPATLKKEVIPGEIVLSEPGANGWTTLLLRLKNDVNYAVCVIHTVRGVATAPNYKAPGPNAKFYGTLSKDSLLSILDWTDREIAVQRYVDLIDRPQSSDTNVHTLYTRFTRTTRSQSKAVA